MLAKTENVIEVVPVMYSQVNWPMLIQLSTQYLGQSITKPLDSERVAPGDYGAYIKALGHLESNPCKPFCVDEWLLLAVDLGVLVVAPPSVHELWRMNSKLPGHGNTQFAIYKASAKEWREIIIRCCRNSNLVFPEARYIACRVYEFLDQAGLREAFTHYNKHALDDGTFELCTRLK